MFTSQRVLIAVLSAVVVTLSLYFLPKQTSTLPLIAVANYGPHASLDETIKGFKENLAAKGFIENESIRFSLEHVNFDPTLILPMLTKLKSQKPQLTLALTTPVAQAAKNVFAGQNLVFADITDPVAAGLIPKEDVAGDFITGASERQDLNALLAFTQKILPKAKRIGLLYASGESNDLALLQNMQIAADKNNMLLVSYAVDQARDVPLRVQAFKDKVDFIYVGTSGPIQPALPAIVFEADRLGIPVINADSDAAKKNLVLASFGVSYTQIGANAADIAAQILTGKTPKEISPIHPQAKDHKGFISQKRAQTLGLAIDPNDPLIHIVE
jgi:putative ABC transport system substrate-binding protein